MCGIKVEGLGILGLVPRLTDWVIESTETKGAGVWGLGMIKQGLGLMGIHSLNPC